MESGTLRISLNKRELILTGANALCLNEKDEIILYAAHEQPITILYFKPCVINNKFELDTLNRTNTLSVSENQDLFYLSQFRHEACLSAKLIGLKAIESSVLKRKLFLIGS